MKICEFMAEIQKTYNKYFPKSKCLVRIWKGLYRSIDVACYLANDKTELSHGYWENDMFSFRFTIDTDAGELSKELTEESEIPNNLKLQIDQNSYVLKPTEKYMAYGRRGFSFRKTKGDPKKIISTLDKYFKKVYDALQEDISNDKISDNHKDLVNKKIS